MHVTIRQSTPHYYATRRAHYAFIIGFHDGYVRPHNPLTRAHIATIIFRLMPHTDRAHYWAQQNPFPDVSLNQWFNNAISTVTNAGIFTGMPDGTFQPQRHITRAELAVSVVRKSGAAPTTTGTPAFNDLEGHWAAGYINTAAANGWITSTVGADGYFRPNQVATRAEAAALFNRMLNRLPETEHDLLPGMVTFPDNMDRRTWYYLYIQEASNSHNYTMNANNRHETWTSLIRPELPWHVLERPYSLPGDLFRSSNR